ncbi:lysylphosphatidylglycerol synthase domain-containing protein [Kineococcus sp. SYSU DK003]|uniref:lysylphosphatidylglycerol synthase domain-containing protein n=1 Tax=Kineococcus sp. SYSU DK003 TaxID=3383124 RepID=UPI003D7C3741
MLNRLLKALRSPVLRVGFLVLVVTLAVVYVVRDRAAIAQAWSRLDAVSVLLALVFSLANVALSGASWRSVLRDLGSPLPVGAAARVFFVGQLGRYIPGTVFQFVAQAELARDHGVPRRRTGSALAVALLVSLTTSSLLITAVLPFALHGRQISGWEWTGWLRWLTPLLLVLLVPGVLNPLLRVLLRLARQEPLEHRITWRGLLASAGWALASWGAVGGQVYVLAHAVGTDWDTGQLLALAVGGYSLAWMAGFLVVLAPAGAGARELVLGATIALATGSGGAAVVVLGSRVLLTVSDLLLAFAALAGHRAEVSAAAEREVHDHGSA